jgi:hypothetical protein
MPGTGAPTRGCESPIGQKGDAAHPFEQLGHVFEHWFADLKLNIAFLSDNFPGERERPVAVRERDAQNLERLGPNETTIKDDRDLAPSPGTQHLLDQRRSRVYGS